MEDERHRQQEHGRDELRRGFLEEEEARREADEHGLANEHERLPRTRERVRLPVLLDEEREGRKHELGGRGGKRRGRCIGAGTAGQLLCR